MVQRLVYGTGIPCVQDMNIPTRFRLWRIKAKTLSRSTRGILLHEKAVSLHALRVKLHTTNLFISAITAIITGGFRSLRIFSSSFHYRICTYAVRCYDYPDLGLLRLYRLRHEIT